MEACSMLKKLNGNSKSKKLESEFFQWNGGVIE